MTINRIALRIYRVLWHAFGSFPPRPIVFPMRAIAEMAAPEIRILNGVMWRPGQPRWRFYP